MESVLILGTGLTGRSVARYLKDKFLFNFFDTRTKEELSQIFIDNREFLENLKPYNQIDLNNYSRVICSPGFDIKHKIYQNIIRKKTRGRVIS